MEIISFNQSIPKNSNSLSKIKANRMNVPSITAGLKTDSVHFTGANFSSVMGLGTKADCKAFIDGIKPVNAKIQELITSFNDHLTKNGLRLNLEPFEIGFRAHPINLAGAYVPGHKVTISDLAPNDPFETSHLAFSINDKAGRVYGKTEEEAILNFMVKLGEKEANLSNVKKSEFSFYDFLFPEDKRKFLPDEIDKKAMDLNQTLKETYEDWGYLRFKDGIGIQNKGELLVNAINKLFKNIDNPY